MSTWTITPYKREYRRAVSDLIFYSNYNQIHLDWHDLDTWLKTDNAIVLLAWRENRLTGILGTEQPLNHVSWLRVAAVDRDAAILETLQVLWDALVVALEQVGTQTVGWLLLEKWLHDYVPRLGFAYQDEIITLRRSGYDLPELEHLPGLRIRSVESRDLSELARIDQAAFDPPWQLSRDDLMHGRRIAATCTVAELHDQPVGYQLSTLYHRSAHLARLAVLPEHQGSGIASAILADLISYFLRRQVRTMTVNTQRSNVRSQNVYHRFGFAPTGYDLPVWLTTL